MSATILVVDDEPRVLRLVQAVFERAGYHPIVCAGPVEALEKSREFPGEIDLLLTDVVMPDMNGVALAARLAAERPSLRILLMSAYTHTSSNLPLLVKPFTTRQLLAQIREVLDGPVCIGSNRK